MKKSTVAITLGIASIFVLITVANVKLSAEYKKGNIRSGKTAIQLPVFHHIKEIRSKDANRFGGGIKLIQHKDSSALLYDYYGSPDILYSVKNDTLFLEPEKNEKSHDYNLIIYYQDVKSIHFSNSIISMQKCTMDSISVTADNFSSLSFLDARLKKIKVEVSDDAKVSISSQDTISHAAIILHDRATFKAEYVSFLEKEIKMNANATISFLGISADNFGIKKAPIQK